MRTSSLTALVALSLVASGCGPRLLRLPMTDAPPLVDTFQQGVNQRRKVFDVEVPEVKKDTQRIDSVTLKFGGAKLGGTEKQNQRSTMTVLRGGQRLVDVECRATQEGVTISRTEFSQHTLACTGAGFTLDLREVQNDVFEGVARFGPVELTLSSSDDMEKGLPQYPTGFHLTAAGRWVGTFEYFDGGRAVIRADLAPHERDAVLSVMTVVHTTGAWLAADLHRNQSRAFGL